MEQMALMGKLLGRHGPPLLNMAVLLRIWRLRRGVRVAELGRNFYLFSFDTAEDFVRAWVRGTVFIGKQCLVLRRWNPKLLLDDRSMCCAQVWVSLPGVRFLEYLSPELISGIRSELGQIIAIDSSGHEVCICVEVDVNDPLVREVKVEKGCQPLQYEIPTLCFNCGRVDHRKEECHTGEGDREYGPQNLAPMRHRREPVFASLVYVTWRPPCSGWVKLNFDGSVKLKSQRGGAGAILRDAEGEFMAGCATAVATSRPLFAEIHALRDGLKLAVNSGVECLLVEGDSRIAIEMLKGWREPESEEKELMEECRNLMKSFKGVKARHEFREANQSADHLANMGSSREGVHLQWRSRFKPPSSLLPFLSRDIAGCLVPRLVL